MPTQSLTQEEIASKASCHRNSVAKYLKGGKLKPRTEQKIVLAIAELSATVDEKDRSKKSAS